MGTYSLDFTAPTNLDAQCYVWDNTNQFVNATVPFPPGIFPGWVIFGYETVPMGPVAITATPEFTITSPATATNAIAVGSYNIADGALSSFSSAGSHSYDDYMDGYQKPDLCAPGDDTSTYGINSTNSRNATGTILGAWLGHNTTYKGTSQAAPHVAGAIALMLQRNSSLTLPQIKNILRQSAVKTGLGIIPNNSWGYGKLNITSAVEAVPFDTSVTPPGLEWLVWLIIIGLILVVVVLIVVWRRKKKEGA
jgi:LPXTG-motif cell wall-anchored protein